MILEFTEEEKKNGKNTLVLEDMVFKAIMVEGEKREYTVRGTAVIDGEIYNNFEIGILLEQELTPKFPWEVLEAEWEEYEFLF